MKTYRLAGRVVAFDAACAETAELMRAYRDLSGAAPERVFRVTPEALEREKDQWLLEFLPEIETSLISRQFYEWLLDHEGSYVHGCAIEMDGNGYLFTADSGVGKSTHACLWRQRFGRDRVRVLNDDKPFVRFDESGAAFVCGSPWCGKVPENENAEAPLRGICVLRQAERNACRPLPRGDAVRALLRQIYLPDTERAMDQALALLDRIVDSVPVYELSCNISEDAAALAYSAMRPRTEGETP